MSETAQTNLDEALSRARRGDNVSFSILVRAHQRSVFGLAVRMLVDMHQAEDLSQEVFLKLYRNLEDIESSAHLGFWLRKVTVNKAIDRLRQASAREVDLSAADEIASEATESDPLLQSHLRKLVGQLPEMARAVILLRYQEDLDPTEIAEALEMPINTVKSHLKRSLSALRGQVVEVPSL